MGGVSRRPCGSGVGIHGDGGTDTGGASGDGIGGGGGGEGGGRGSGTAEEADGGSRTRLLTLPPRFAARHSTTAAAAAVGAKTHDGDGATDAGGVGGDDNSDGDGGDDGGGDSGASSSHERTPPPLPPPPPPPPPPPRRRGHARRPSVYVYDLDPRQVTDPLHSHPSHTQLIRDCLFIEYPVHTMEVVHSPHSYTPPALPRHWYRKAPLTPPTNV